MARSYFLRDTTQANTAHAASTHDDLGLETAAGASVTGLSEILLGATDEITHQWTTPSNEPNSAAWPTGLYRIVVNISAIGDDVTGGALNLGGSTGHLARMNSGASADQESNQQSESAWGSTGVLPGSFNGSWTAGAAGDRFEVLICAIRTLNHGNQVIQIDVNDPLASAGAGGIADGPWPDIPIDEQMAAVDTQHSLPFSALQVEVSQMGSAPSVDPE